MEVEYERWLTDERAELLVPSGAPADVGAFVGELLWMLYHEVYDSGPPAIEYDGLPGTARTTRSAEEFVAPRGMVAVMRLQDLRRLTEDVLETFPDEYGRGWCRTRLLSLWDAPSGSWRARTFEEAADEAGVTRKTAARWVGAVDEELARRLEAQAWRV